MFIQPVSGISSLSSSKKILWYFIFFWLILNVLQAYFTGLFKDEAYYFFYSRNLAWGYYDHPPLLALFIRSGYSFISNELGVRLVVVLISALTFLIMRRLSGGANDRVFIALFFSFPVFHITGFLAIPDASLVFFTALFFLVYRDFSLNRSPINAILLGLVMAGLFYSKYLGIMIVLFTVLSNIRLVLSGNFWLAVAVTTAVFLPHLAWQYLHDFPSVYYHLLERSHDEFFEWVNFGDYFAGQAAMINPLLFIPVIWHLFRFKPANHYERALKFSAAGSLLLPVLMMLRGRVEANWTIAGLVPLFLISCVIFANRSKLKKYLYYTFFISFLLIILARLALVIHLIPASYQDKIHIESHGWKEFSEEVSQLSGDRPVVFISSYQNASEYRFYSGKEAFSFNSALYRNNQYDLENIEVPLQGKEVLLIFSRKNLSDQTISEYALELADSIRLPGGRHQHYLIKENYRSYNFLPIEILAGSLSLQADTEIEVPILLKNPGDSPIFFSKQDQGGVYLTWMLLQYGKPVLTSEFEDISGLVLEKDYVTSFRLKAPLQKGTYYLRVNIKSGWLPPGINSRIFKVKVT